MSRSSLAFLTAAVLALGGCEAHNLDTTESSSSQGSPADPAVSLAPASTPAPVWTPAPSPIPACLSANLGRVGQTRDDWSRSAAQTWTSNSLARKIEVIARPQCLGDDVHLVGAGGEFGVFFADRGH